MRRYYLAAIAITLLIMSARPGSGQNVDPGIAAMFVDWQVDVKIHTRVAVDATSFVTEPSNLKIDSTFYYKDKWDCSLDANGRGVGHYDPRANTLTWQGIPYTVTCHGVVDHRWKSPVTCEYVGSSTDSKGHLYLGDSIRAGGDDPSIMEFTMGTNQPKGYLGVNMYVGLYPKYAPDLDGPNIGIFFIDRPPDKNNASGLGCQPAYRDTFIERWVGYDGHIPSQGTTVSMSFKCTTQSSCYPPLGSKLEVHRHGKVPTDKTVAAVSKLPRFATGASFALDRDVDFDLVAVAGHPDLKVAFQDRAGAALPPILKVGISKGGHDRTQHLQAVVTPASSAQDVTLVPTLGIKITSMSAHGGTIDFDVVGVEQSNEAGDNSISAIVLTDPVAQVSDGQPPRDIYQAVSVVVPARIIGPHDVVGQGVVPGNWVEDSTTSPAQPQIPAGQAVLVTGFYRFLTIRVADQLGEPLDATYEGAVVTEQQKGRWYPINQALTSTGTYVDPVGFDWNPRLDPMPGWPSDLLENGIVPANGPDARAWPNLPMMQITINCHLEPTKCHLVQNIAVSVDGFVLQPAIVNRTADYIPQSNGVTVSWP